MVRLFCAFRKNLWVLLEKEAFREDSGEEERYKEARGTKNKATSAKQARHDRALRCTTVRPRATSTGGPKNWYGLAVLGGTIVRPSTVRSCCLAGPCQVVQRRFKRFRDDFVQEL